MENEHIELTVNDTFEIIKYLPKYLRTSIGDVYILNFIKNDWDYHDNSYIARYAKLNNTSISTVKFKVEVQGTTFENVVFLIYKEYRKLCIEGKANGKNWI
jgi:hypothetical protein